MQPLIELKNVSFAYAGRPALEEINLHLHPGQFAAVVGPSGAGKTTLLRLLLGCHEPNQGRIALYSGGRPLQISYVPQIESVDWNFPVTVEQVVLMGQARRSGLWPWPSRVDRQRLAAVLAELGIGDLARRHIRELSGGQQQRVFLARALIAEPDLLVLDEPTTGLDLRTAETILHLLAHLNQQGMTVLLSSHDLNAMAAHLPWVICLNRRIIAEGPPEEIFSAEILNRTYQGDMLVVRQNGMLLVQQRPHPHTVHDILDDPVLGHSQPHAN